MHPSKFAATTPDNPAIILGESGVTTNYAELEERSNQGAHLFLSLGLQQGDIIAILLENVPEYFEMTWSAQRCGLRYVCRRLAELKVPRQIDFMQELPHQPTGKALPAPDPIQLPALAAGLPFRDNFDLEFL